MSDADNSGTRSSGERSDTPIKQRNRVSGPLGPVDTRWRAWITDGEADAADPLPVSRTRGDYTPMVHTDDHTPRGDTRSYPPNTDVADPDDYARRLPLPRRDPGSLGVRTERTDDPRSIAMRQRLAADQAATGRNWPPEWESALPQLARDRAAALVRASRLPGADPLAPTDISAIAHVGMGLSLRPLDCSRARHVLAVYFRGTHDVYFDWSLLREPPVGEATFDTGAWRRCVDAELAVRLVLARVAAARLLGMRSTTLVIGFSAGGLADYGGVGTTAATMPHASETVAALDVVAELLAPAHRLRSQLGASESWGLDTSARSHPGSAHATRQWNPGTRESVAAYARASRDALHGDVLAQLAARNNCPRALIEWQLDPDYRAKDCDVITQTLVADVPSLRARLAHLELAGRRADRGTTATAAALRLTL